MTNILTDQNMKEFFPLDFYKEQESKKKVKSTKLNLLLRFLWLKHNKELYKIVEKNIVSDKNIRKGQPTIKGTRITVQDMMYILNDTIISGNDLEYIYEQYPSITDKKQVLAAILYDIKKTNSILMTFSIMCS